MVYAPDYYQHFSEMLEEDLFPIYNLVWIGIYNGKKGLCAYTGGSHLLTAWGVIPSRKSVKQQAVRVGNGAVGADREPDPFPDGPPHGLPPFPDGLGEI